MPRPSIDEAGLSQLLSLARLEVTPERKAVVGPALDLVLGLMDSLDSVDVGETPPATAFDPSWR